MAQGRRKTSSSTKQVSGKKKGPSTGGGKAAVERTRKSDSPDKQEPEYREVQLIEEISVNDWEPPWEMVIAALR